MERADAILSQLFTKDSRHLLYERGDMIIRAGDTPSGVYLITDGWVKVYSLCEDGEPNIIMSLGVGDIFPLEWAISGVLRDVSFTAIKTTAVSRIPRDQFTRSLRTHPQLSQAALMKLAHYFCQLSDELEHIPYHSARERVAFRLVSLVEWFGTAQTDQAGLELRIPNEYIARSSNMTRETASREISWLTKKGVIERRNENIIIKDLIALRKEVGKNF